MRKRIVRSVLWFCACAVADLVDILFDVQYFIARCGLRAAVFLVVLLSYWMSLRCDDAEGAKEVLPLVRVMVASWIRKLGVAGAFERNLKTRRDRRLRVVLGKMLCEIR